jgi:hypothetical protein
LSPLSLAFGIMQASLLLRSLVRQFCKGNAFGVFNTDYLNDAYTRTKTSLLIG